MKLKRRIPVLVLPALLVTTMSSSAAFLPPVSEQASSPSSSADSLLAEVRGGDEASRASRSRSEHSVTTFDTTTTIAVPVTEAPVTTTPDTSAPSAPAAAPPAPRKLPVATTAAPAAKEAAAPARQTSNAPATTAAPTTQPRAASVPANNVDEFLLKAINGERSARGLAPLRLDPTLSKLAQNWSAKMGANGAMSHSGTGIPSGFNAFGENVLKASSGTTAGAMHNMWLASAGHRKQILQPGFDRVGIAAVCVNGSVYATEMFGHSEAAGEANLSNEVPDAAPQAPVSGGPTCG
jgi:uncharacterized protein YkwD